MRSRFRPLLLVFVLGLIALPLPAAENLLKDGSFELGKNWRLFVPTGSESHMVDFEYVKGGLNGSTAGRLSAQEITRAGLANTRFAVIPGERYKVTFHYKAEPNGVTQRGRPGVAFRINSIDANKTVMAPIFILVDGTVVPSIDGLQSAPVLATEWTKVEATVVAPPGVATFDINLFLWGYQGAVLFDNVSLE